MISDIHFYFYTIVERILRAFIILIEPLPERPSKRHRGPGVLVPRRSSRRRSLTETDIEGFFDAADQREHR